MPFLSSNLPLDCNLLSPFAFCLSPFFSSPWHIWITYHFPDCAPKKVKHSLPFSFLTDVKARRLPVVAEIDPGQTRERESSKIPLCSVHRLIWPCAVWMKQYKVIRYLTALKYQYFFFQITSNWFGYFWHGRSCTQRSSLFVEALTICVRWSWVTFSDFFLFVPSNSFTYINAGLHKLALKCQFISTRLLFL